jgi:hypothetical protein
MSRVANRTLKQKPGFVYFVRMEADPYPIKIGYATSIQRRLNNLRCSCPYELTLIHFQPGSPKDEKAFHEAFDYLRLRGEWFTNDGELADFLEDRWLELCGITGDAYWEFLESLTTDEPASMTREEFEERFRLATGGAKGS